MNEQVVELIQTMKDEYGDRWAAQLLLELLRLGKEPISKPCDAYWPLFVWITDAIAAHDALVSALEPFVAAYAIMSLDSDRGVRQYTPLDFDGSYAAGSDLTQDNLFDARAALAPRG